MLDNEVAVTVSKYKGFACH